MTIRRISLAAGLALAAVGCSNEDLITPPVPLYKGGAMFQRYVSMGNSITAGVQSGGINDSTQQQSYAALVAGKMGSPLSTDTRASRERQHCLHARRPTRRTGCHDQSRRQQPDGFDCQPERGRSRVLA